MIKSLLAATAVVAAVLTAVPALASKAKKAELHVPQSDVTWTQPYGPQGPSFGFVVGKFGDKKPASFFIKFPAGGDSGWHLHDEDYEGVVVQGTFSEQQQGDAAETPLPAGSYFTQPGKQNHRNGCLKGADCLLFVHFEHGASSHPTSPDGKLLPPPPTATAKATK